MSVTIRQLHCFVAVARSGSFAEACILLHLSQPALSIAIRNLESEIGGKLLERSTRAVALTPEGERFLPVVQRLLGDWERSLEDVRNLFALRRGKLDIAAVPTFASSLLPGVLARYHRQYPDINITVHDVITEDVVDMVREGRVELGITFDPGDAADLSFTPLFRDRFVAALPADHALLEKRSLKWRDLQEVPYLALQRPSSIRLLIDRNLQEHGINLVPAFEAHQLASIGRMVAAGLGFSVVPALSASQMQEMGASCRPLSGPVITRELGVITRRRQPLSTATRAMLEVIGRGLAPRAPRPAPAHPPS
jgi:LysR family carnitine catabolism transcriptional activator